MRKYLKSISPANTLFKCLLGLIFMATLMAGCGRNSSADWDLGSGTEGHPLAGEVISIDASASTIEVAHEDIPGFMPAMTMRFGVEEGDLLILKEGQKIRARLVRDEDGGFRLLKVWPLDGDDARDLKRFNERLQSRLRTLPRGYYWGEGDDAAEFALLDQNGRLTTSDSFKGQPVMVNFIFTRCPDANMCPLSTSKMVQLQRLAAEAGLRVQFVSITLDPEYDTPGTLKQYAAAYGVDEGNFRFLTGPKPAVMNLLRSYGVSAIDKVDTIMHSLATMLVDGSGKIVMRSEKSAWEPAAFLEAMRSLDSSE